MKYGKKLIFWHLKKLFKTWRKINMAGLEILVKKCIFRQNRLFKAQHGPFPDNSDIVELV